MRGWFVVLPVVAVGCGRIGFTERPDADESPAPDGPVQGFSRIDAFADQTCALFDGRAYCWGSNAMGQLGDGTTTSRSVPTEVALPAGAVTAVAPGHLHGCAIVGGGLWCWGEGFGATPVPVALPAPATAVDSGVGGLTCAIAGATYCWGENRSGQLGDGTTVPRATPAPIVGPEMAVIHVGDDHVCALPRVGTTPQCWGHNDDGTLGTGSFTPLIVTTPGDVVGGLTSLPRIAGWHACALEVGELWCWGLGGNGELGTGAFVSSAIPVRVPALANVSEVATGGGLDDLDASCAIVDGGVWCWGMGLNGRLGNGLTDPQPSPVAVAGLPGPAVEIALGFGHTCARLVDGDLWCWGRGVAGQLGHGVTSGSLTPVRVTPPR